MVRALYKTPLGGYIRVAQVAKAVFKLSHVRKRMAPALEACEEHWKRVRRGEQACRGEGMDRPVRALYARII